MSPRRNQRRRAGAQPLDAGRARRGVETAQTWADGEWTVRLVPGGAAPKAYRCPGCDHEIAPGVPHVVAWLTEGRPAGAGGLDDRRHWHSGCWRARDRRTPNIQRSRTAPRYG